MHAKFAIINWVVGILGFKPEMDRFPIARIGCMQCCTVGYTLYTTVVQILFYPVFFFLVLTGFFPFSFLPG